MTDLLTRLRQLARAEHDDLDVVDEAVEEIVNLRTDVHVLQEMLERYKHDSARCRAQQALNELEDLQSQNHPNRQGRVMDKLFCDMKTDEEKAAFFLSGRGYETGVISQAIQNDVAMAYHRCAEYKKELEALQSQDREGIIKAARAAMNESFEVGDEYGSIGIPSDRAAYLSLLLDEYDHARRIEGEG